VVNQNEDSGERSEDEAYNNTRRQFVAGSAGALGGIAVGSALSGSVLAQDDGEEEPGTDDGTPVENEFEDDVAILNYALTLEYLEASFYRQGLENINEEDLCNCKALSEDSHLRERAYGELTTIQQHEEQHVETLVSTIESLGGTPVEEPEFDFGLAVEYPMAFLATAVQLEDIGVSAYAGAAPSIESEDLLPPALGIHSVEARHAAFLRTLNGQTSFPDVIDAARSRSEVLELAGAFIVDDGDGGTDGTETEMPTDTETEMPTTNGTEMPTDTGTEMPTTNGTETNGS
jgi:rubrerythrin